MFYCISIARCESFEGLIGWGEGAYRCEKFKKKKKIFDCFKIKALYLDRFSNIWKVYI